MNKLFLYYLTDKSEVNQIFDQISLYGSRKGNVHTKIDNIFKVIVE